MSLVRKRPLTPDSAGRYRPRIGWKFGEDGVRRQHKFNLGTDRKEAERRYARIQALYEDDCQRNATQQIEPGCWSARALKYAIEIASGAAAVQISLDPWQTGHVDSRSVVELQQGIEHARRDYPSLDFVPADPTECEASAQQNQAIVLDRLQSLEAELRSSGILTAGMPAIQRLVGVTVRKALDMFEAHLVASPK